VVAITRVDPTAISLPHDELGLVQISQFSSTGEQAMRRLQVLFSERRWSYLDPMYVVRLKLMAKGIIT
jgi:hypothetical protein